MSKRILYPVKLVFYAIIQSLFVVFCLAAILFIRIKRRRNSEPRLVWGSTPLLNNKYWSEALKLSGMNSVTLMSEFFYINKRDDFDLYFQDFFKSLSDLPILGPVTRAILPYYIFIYSLLRFDIFHIPAHGYILHGTSFHYLESFFLRIAGKKTVVIPYGSDFYRYSRINDPSLRNALLKSYPVAARRENIISKSYEYWIRNADIIITGAQIDGNGRWDLLPFNCLTIKESDWKQKQKYSDADGTNAVVKILHTPNHSGFKGSEFIIDAVDKLKKLGLKVELILLTGVSNDKIKDVMANEADILVEQLIFTGYALSGLEGMSTGIPVLSNLDSEYYTRVFRRYSYINECPILSTTPESIFENLKILVTNPSLRMALGKAGRKYVEKYHSYAAAQYMFTQIYDKIWYNKEVDLMNMFHPLYPDSFNNQSPLVLHPLTENKLPAGLETTLENYV